MAKNILLGVKKFKSKAGKDFEVMVLVSECDAREIENGCFGNLPEEIFVPDAFAGKLKPADVGKEIALDYEIKGGRAYLIGFDVKK